MGWVGTHSEKEKWQRRARERRWPVGPGGSTWACKAVLLGMGGLELWQTRATQPGQKKRRWREREPFTNEARPRGRLCLNKQERKRRLANKPGWPA